MSQGAVEAARAIRPFLRELLPPTEADELDGQIATLLNADMASEVGIRRVLESREATSDFLAEVLEDAPLFRPPKFQERILRDAIFNPLPGDAMPVHAGKYGCPKHDYVWYRPSSGTEIPRCPTHGLELTRLA
jgi:hypothetical protein